MVGLGLSQCFGFGSVIASSWGRDMSVCMVVANNVHHGSYGDRRYLGIVPKWLYCESLYYASDHNAGSLITFPMLGTVMLANYHVRFSQMGHAREHLCICSQGFVTRVLAQHLCL